MAHKAASIREACLDGKDAAIFNIVAVHLIAQHFANDTSAIIERICGFKKRRNIKVFLKPVTARKIKHAQRGEAVFSLSNEQADRRCIINIFMDLRR